MIGDSFFELCIIRSSITALRAITPASFLYIGLSFIPRVARATRHIGLRALWWYAAAECTFFIGVYLPHKRRVEKVVVTPPALIREDRSALFAKCLEAIPDTEEFLRGWFYGAPVGSIQRENLREWITWALFSSDIPLGDDAGDWLEESDGYIVKVETLSGLKFLPGRNLEIKSMRLSVDHLHVIHRPLLWYLIVLGIDLVTYIGLTIIGMRHFPSSAWFETFPPRPQNLLTLRRSPNPDISYWYRPHRSTTKQPVVLIHGIGIGLFAYIELVRDVIRADADVGIIVVEVLPVSMRIISPTRAGSSPHALCEALRDVLIHHGFDKFVLVGHSYGTFLAAHILHHPQLSSRITSLVLMDPITFLLFHPFLVYSFVYRVPGARRANEWMIWYFTSRDIGIATLLARSFFWTDGVLFKNDNELTKRRTLITLGGKDQIIDAENVWAYLTNGVVPSEGDDEYEDSGIKDVMQWEEGSIIVRKYGKLDHAQILVSSASRRAVVDRIAQLDTT